MVLPDGGLPRLIDILRDRAAEEGGSLAYAFLAEGETEEESLSWAGLDRRARAIAVHLATVAAPGERALLLFPGGLDFIAAFFGCLYAGVVAVPTYPPRPGRAQPRLRAIARDARPSIVLTDRALAAKAAGLAGEVPELAAARWIATDGLADAAAADASAVADDWRDPGVGPDHLAFLQYTSGSTALPKGVMVTHGNLAANERMIQAAFRQSASSVVVGWLPLYHDMGLIGNVLQPLWSGGRCVLMSPVAFLQKPLRWLAAISRYGATTSGGPNFAYDLCVRKITEEDRAGLDLSSWEVAYNGAEPVRPATLDRFAAAFAPCGFRRAALYPCYGLAEATLFAAGGDLGEGGPRTASFDAAGLARGRALPAAPDTQARELAACGRPFLEQELAIVDPETRRRLPDGEVGEIWIGGPNVAAGYWDRPEESAATFEARTDDGGGPYLRTGDLGFRSGGELFVTGRRKDLIILRGRNLYPQDLEATAEAAHPALRPGCGAAFPVEQDGEERLVLVYEMERRAGVPSEKIEEIAAAVRAAVAGEHEAQVADLVLVKVGGVPKTSSGKIQRHACRDAYLAGALAVAARSAAGEAPAGAPDADEAEGPALLRALAARALGCPPERIEPGRPLAAYGLDSLAALELRTAVEERFGVALPLAALFEGATLDDLVLLVASGAEPRQVVPPAPAVEATDELPLSAGQEGLWIAERLAPETGVYNLAGAFRAAEPEEGIDPRRLRAAVESVVARHPALRLRFRDVDGAPRQRVAAESAIDVAVEEALGWTGAEVQARLAAEAWQPFDLAEGPLVRVRLLRGAPGGDAVLFVFHHATVDFASLTVVAREIAAAWRGSGGAGPVTGDSYASFVRWQRDRLAGPEGERLRAFWRERLGGGLADLDLPADRPRPPAQSFRGLAARGALPRATVERLEGLARAGGATLQTVLLAGWSAWLHRLSGQDGFAVGLPAAGRFQSRFAETVGYFIHPVAVRARTEGDPGFGALLARTRDELLAALEHAEDPFARIAAELRPVRDPSRPPLVQTMLVHHAARGPEAAALAPVALGAAGARLDLGGLRLATLELPEPRAPFDLTLRTAPGPWGELGLALEASADLFDRTTAMRSLDQIARLLAAAAHAPETALSALPLLAEAERHQLLAEWNDTGIPDEPAACLDELVEPWEEAAAETLAVADASESITYRELRERSLRLAWTLRDLGVAEGLGAAGESRVALCLDRSADLIVAALAVLRAGGAYAPIDPAYPEDRRADMVAVSGARVIVTLSYLAGAWCGDAAVLALDREREALEAAPAAGRTGPPPCRRDPEQLAYVIFTSGSTGQPKGVGVTHRGAVHIVSGYRRRYGWTREDRGSHVSGVSFDAAVIEIWPALAAGASLHVAPPDVPLAPAALLGWLARERVTIGWTPTPVTEMLLAEPAPPGLALRRLTTGGDRLHGRPPAGASYRLANMYGPAENAVVTTEGEVPPDDAAPLPSIGRPLAGVRVYLLDRALALAPRGVPGELCAGGRGLARGYLGDPAQTAERFLPDPFSGVPGSRMYRTGDLARFRPDGAIDFLGRIDTQVKIRGQRIELGEIEAALAELPAVREAAVLALPERPGAAGLRLVAYVALEPGAAAEDRDLIEPLARRLTEAMVPRAFVRLERLPATANGKVDRRALAALAPAAPPAGETAPRTAAEARIAAVWAEVLGLPRVGVEDDFFALGGHSLLAARLGHRLGQELGVEVPARALFEAPTVARLAERLGALPATPATPALPLAPVERGGPLPASFAQQRLWFLARLEPESPAYHVPGRLALRGALDAAALAAALHRVAARHEALRTGFGERLDGPVQEIAERVEIALPAVDLTALPAPLRRAEAGRAAALAACHPFDLARPPLLRAVRLALGPEENEVLLTLHHLVSDGWSLGRLADELGTAYGAFVAGVEPVLPDLPVQIADAAVWERRWLAEGEMERESRYWAAQLAGEPSALELPLDRPRPAIVSSRGGRTRLELDISGAALDGCARDRSATPFMVLAAAWAAVLARFGGRDDLLIGTPVSVRDRPELEPLIGCLVNTVPLRADLGGDPPFAGLVDRLRAVCLGAWAHRHLPYERLVEMLRPGRDAAQAPLFQAFLQMEEPPRAPRLAGLAATLEPLPTDTAKFDLTLALERRGDRLAASLEYARDLFDAATAERLLGAFGRLFAGALAAPAAPLSALPLLSGAERARLLAWSGAGERLAASGALLHERFERLAAAAPWREALVWGTERWTYGDLERRSRRIAGRLLARGVGAEDRVAVCLGRGADLVAALLGVLRAGAAYVPIDPAYPAERIGWMLEDAQARVLITDLGELGVMEEGEEPPLPRTESAGGAGLAYVIYTSGSTGRPKGVAISHASASALVDWAADHYEEDELSGVLAATSVCFDLSVFEIFVPLSLGGRVIVAENALELPFLPACDEVRLVNTVPSAVAELVRGGVLPSSVRTVNLAGEALPRPLVDALYAQPTVARVANLYGPSEDTTYSTWEVVPPAEAVAPGIGRPLPETRAWILDRGGALAPAGVPGELCLAGPGLARGYLGRPDLTAERFVPEVWGGEAGARMYRTGDLARYRPNGRLEFLGRIDQQVKVRGFRVELGEIEAQLLALPGVREAAVAADAAAGRLIAWVAREGEGAVESLGEALAARLPRYMVPAVWIELERLPRTPNGKLDRKALPRPDAAATGAAAPGAGVPPRGRLEERLAALFAEALQRPGIGRDDDFFALGGHSLLAAGLVFRLRQELGLDVPLLAMFEAPTVASLAARIAAGGTAELDEGIPAVPRDGALQLSFAQERLWFLEQLEGSSPLYHIAVGFAGAGRLDAGALRAAFAAVWSRHEALRARFAIRAGQPVQSFAPAGPEMLLAEIDLSDLAGAAPAAADQAAAAVAFQPFDLARGPLLRAALLRLGPERFRLALAVHHLVADGVSLAILERELGIYYRAALGLPALPAEQLPPPLALQHADLALWQRSRMTGERLAPWIAELGAELGDAIEPLELPTDRPRPAVSRRRGATHATDPWLDGGELAAALARLAGQLGATPYQVWLAAFGALLGRLARRESLTVGLPVSGRTAASRDLVGLFADTRVVRVDLAGDPTAAELIAAARDRLLVAEERAVPFEKLVEALAPARSLSFAPLYQVTLAARPATGRGLELPDIELAPLPLGTPTARRDLTLFVDATAAAAGSGLVEHDVDLFDASTVQRWIGQLGRLIAGMAARPAARLSELPLLSAAERQQILVEWSEAAWNPVGAGGAVLLDELVEPWERAAPGALAVADASGSVTYGALRERSRRLAWRLRDLGVGGGLGVAEESIVALCLDRSAALVVAALGTMRAGGAYAPIDPAYPEARRADMVAVAKARVILTLSHLAGAWCGDAAVIALDVLEGPFDLEREDRPGFPPRLREPERLAYAMFTSGSTGRPKGVGMSHRGAVHIVSWHRRRYGWTRADRSAQVSGVSFDAAVNEIWPALGAGASIHVPPPETRLAPAALLDWFARERVTVTWVPTPIAEALLVEPAPPGLALRYLQTGGDRLHRRASAGAPYLLNNHYGPVENAVLSTEGDIPPEGAPTGPGASALPTIGRPLDGVRVYLLDPALALAPWGAPGELFLGGRGVARGYLGDPAQTAQRFLPDPFSGVPGSRMYRTGDLVRFRPDGEIDFLGRIDTQVKIRGQRIELGEVEAALVDLPAVREAAVVVRQEAPGAAGKRLVAYVVLEPGAAVEDRDLVEPLARRLTEAMVPRAFVRLDRLPATANGKVDRRALAAIAPAAPAVGTAEPRNPIEARIAAVWAEVLGLERAGIHDDFFDLGGHSLLAAQLTWRLRDELGVEVPVALLFEAPTVAGLAERLADLAPAFPAAAEQHIPRAGRSAPLPLSFAQERLWFLEQLEGPSPLYHIPAAFDGTGPLNAGALRAAVAAVQARHEALRARFVVDGGRPLQTFAPPGEPPFLVVDGTAAARELDGLTAEIVRRPFDLARDPLLRVVVLRTGAESFRLVLVLHHLVADGVSLTVLERDLGVFYDRALGRPVPEPPPLALQHADVALWQRERLERPDGELARRLAAVSAELDGAADPLELPFDRPRSASVARRGAMFPLEAGLDRADAAAALARLARRCGASAFQVWFAAFAALLGRLAGRASFTVGLPVAGRTAASRDLVGLFVDTLVVRADCAGDPAGEEMVARARAGLLAAEARSAVPFEKLVEILAPARDRAVSPLFQVALVARPTGGRRLALPGVVLEPLPAATGTAKWDLTLSVDPEAATGGAGVVEYDADLFDAATVRRWMGQLGRLLAAMAERPGARLSELPWMAEAERHQVLVEWNEAAWNPVGAGGAVLLDELVEPWERATPDALAVADASESITYGELRARSLRLAWRLRSLGIAEGPGVADDARVALCLDRSAALVVAALGTLRAGGAWTPIDPAYPEARRADMVAIAGARVIITLSHLAGAWCGDAAVVFLDDGLDDGLDREPPRRLRDPERLAYVIFTSGSTGRPKGVAMSHRGAVHLVAWHRRAYGWTPGDRASQVSGVGFDAAVIEIWPALAAGASLHVAPPDVRLAPAALLDWLARERMTVGWAPTPVLDGMLAEPAPPGLALRWLQTGGDRLHGRPPAGAPYRLKNHYGPAENAVITTEGEIRPDGVAPARGASSLPTIGRPLDGIRVYLLDGTLAPVPWGAPGELCAAGRGLARGYLGDPAQTAERFLPDPFSGVPGGRMYRTGDLARFRPDGELEFLGRIDTQVKIRGQRIELGEIEAALVELPAVREAAVLVRQDEPGAAGRRLVAYVVLEPGAAVEDRDLSEPLARRLTEAMVPRAFVHLDRLPVTVNGKVDRRALAALVPAAPAVGATEPRTALEARLAALWAETLGLDRVGVEDDFFALGGHSLLAARLSYRLRRELGVEVPVSLIFDAPTVARLAERLAALPSAAPGETIPRADRSAPLPLSFSQERLWFLEQLEGPSPLYHMAAAFDGTGRLDAGALRAAVAAVWARHEALRARFVIDEGHPLQTFAPPGLPPVLVVDGAAAARELDGLTAEIVRRPFDLERGPLLRVVVLRTGAESFRLVLVLHHLVADGVSLTVLESELGIFYRRALGLPVPEPPPLALQHADVALWQRERLERPDGELAGRLAAVRAELDGATDPLELPFDRPRIADAGRRGAVRPLGDWLDGPATAAALARLARRCGASAFQVWLAAFAALLGRLSGRESFTIGVPVSGRTAASRDLVGLFVDTLVVRADLDGDPGGEEMVARARARLLAAEARAAVPFEKLVQALAPVRDRAVSPLFQVALVARPAGDWRLALPGVELAPLPGGTGTAKWDLTLAVDPGLAADVRGAVELDAGLFDATTVQRWIGALGRLLAAMAEEPARRLSALPLLAEGESFQILHRRPRAAAAPAARPAYVAPRTAAEARLAALWGEILDAGRVGVEDDFFALGGHSLLAARLSYRLRREMGVEVPVSLVFDAPTVARLAERLAVLPAAAAGETIPRADRSAPLRLSFAQERLWFLEQMEGPSPLYHIGAVFDGAGRLDTRALRQAVAAVCARHEALRARFAATDGLPFQTFAPPGPPDLLEVDATGVAAPAAAVDELAAGALRRPFDLARGPLLRVVLVRTGAERFRLVLAVHHLVADGVSLTVLERELSLFYRKALGLPVPAPAPLALQHADVAVWQRERLERPEGELAGRLAAAQAEIAGAAEPLELPADRPRSLRGRRGEVLALGAWIGAEAAPAVARCARRSGASAFQVWLAAFAALLGRLTGRASFTLGVPVAGRTAASQDLVGLFVDTLVVRADLAGDPGGDEMVRRARARLLAAESAAVPFEKLVELVAPARDRAVSPLFQVALVARPTGDWRLALPGAELAPRSAGTGTAKWDLTLAVDPDFPADVRGAVELDAGLFDPATVARWMGALGRLLAAMAEDPARPLSMLPLLAEAERFQVLVEWAAPAAGSPRRSIPEVFAEQVRRAPGAVALLGREPLTYAELDARSSRLARHLAALGVGLETRVGLCVERTPEMVVAILAVLKAGAAYVPLDHELPAERLAWMAADAGIQALVVSDRLREPLESALPAADRALVLLERDAERIAARSPRAPEVAIPPEALAYVLYTSGSTGRPKGVAVPHRSVVRLVCGSDFAALGPDEVFLQLAPVSFDASTLELWGPLLNGGRLAVHPTTRVTVEELGAALAEHGVTALWLTAGLFHLVVDEGVERLAGLRQLLAGGDVLSVPRVRRALAALPGVRLIDGYGPTENTTFTCCQTISDADAAAGAIPIGRPVAGTRVLLLDRGFAPVGIGVPGELCAGGDGLARGYLGRPGLTAERFVPDPWSGEAGARLYRTGDLARWRAGGRLEFLGRLDRQVKVRGFRVEPGEIEAALLAEPGVAAAVVTAPADAGGDRRLVAYVVPGPGGGLDPAALAAGLRRRLPEPLVPARFVLLERLPLDANGKVDRRALPDPGDLGAAADEPPATPAERALAAIWEELLGRERIGRGASFFDLGGHSLLAARMVERIRRALGVELPLAALFEEPTLAGLARRIEEAGPVDSPPPPIPPADRARPLPLSFAQQRLWLLDRLEPGSATYTIPAAVALSGRLDVGALRAALVRLAGRHESLRTTFALLAGEPVQRIAAAGSLELPLADLGALPEARRAGERDRLYRVLAAQPFDLERGPLARLLLVATGAGEQALLLALHHSISDGWSIGVLVRDLAALYGELAGGRPAALPALAVQVADHAAWQRGELAGERLAGRLAWWRERLAGAPPALELPLDRPRPPMRSFRGATRTQVLPPALADRVRALANARGATLFMTLLAGWKLLLGRLAGQDDVVVGAPAAERGRPELEPLIGMFLNTLVLRTRLDGVPGSGAPGFGELVGRVRATVLDAFAHELPFELLLDELNPARDLSRTPLFQVFFNMLNFPAVELSAEGIEISGLTQPAVPAKFDLTVYAAEEGGAIRLDWVANADLFDPARIDALLDQYAWLLAQAVEDPGRPAAGLSLVAPAAAALLPDPGRALSDAWAGSVQERFAAWAGRAPERLAVADPHEAWSYGELAARAHRLAQRLRRDGVRPGDVVAILGHRSARLVWAVLGALEAGAAFTILDPAHPPQRLAETLRLARPRGFVAVAAAGPVPAGVEDCLDGLGLASRLRLPAADPDEDGEDPTAGEPETAPDLASGPDDLAYLSFTSGSTGIPKGILGRHGPLSHFIPWQERRFGFGPDDRYSMLSGLAHDPLQRDLFTPLQTGAAVIAPDPADIARPGRLAAWMRDAGITVAHLTPAMGQILCQLAPGEPAPVCDRLRWAFFVGDVLTRRDVARLAALAPGVTVVNYYGSTETQRSVGYHLVADPAREAETEAAKQSLPLGRGIEDVQLLVVNPAGRLAGVGELGEILVRGPHLAAGYLGDPAGTAARFIPSPLAAQPDDPHDRVYRTGDLGRYLPDGEVEFAGRADVQVKIRGFRIEPGEVEAWLGRHPAVRECVVVARDHAASGEKRLVAYIVLAAPATPAELRAFLKERLPDSMVPAAFAILEKLPVNPNGKVDRRALPEPVEEPRGEGSAAPQTEIERALAAILREVLGAERVGKDDNFFELGGSSLQLVKVHARVQETFGRDLQVVELFTHPTVAALAAFLSHGEGAPRPAAVVEDRTGHLQTGRDRLRRRRQQAGQGEA